MFSVRGRLANLPLVTSVPAETTHDPRLCVSRRSPSQTTKSSRLVPRILSLYSGYARIRESPSHSTCSSGVGAQVHSHCPYSSPGPSTDPVGGSVGTRKSPVHPHISYLTRKLFTYVCMAPGPYLVDSVSVESTGSFRVCRRDPVLC